jgi:hypothetical protein
MRGSRADGDAAAVAAIFRNAVAGAQLKIIMNNIIILVKY